MRVEPSSVLQTDGFSIIKVLVFNVLLNLKVFFTCLLFYNAKSAVNNESKQEFFTEDSRLTAQGFKTRNLDSRRRPQKLKT